LFDEVQIMTRKERFLAVIDGRTADRVPVFPLLMSFAAMRHNVSYREFASDGRILAEAQQRIAEKFPVDAVTACSDAFRVSADLGGAIVFEEDSPPHLSSPLIRNTSDFAGLRRPDPLKPGSRMADRVLGAGLLAESIGMECMVIGWVDMPFAEACSACGMSDFMMMLYDEPEFAHRILEFLTDIVIDFALAQLAAGMPMVGAGDAAASLISPALYREFALPYEQRVIDAVHKAGGLVKLHICGNTSKILPAMAESGADLFNVDHRVDFQSAKELYTRAGKAYKGNLNPVADMLQSSPGQCFMKSRRLIEAAKGSRYILSPGCEVPGGVSDEVFASFCSAAESASM
jgi:MtaA/CmuA family methyltransferase